MPCVVAHRGEDRYFFLDFVKGQFGFSAALKVGQLFVKKLNCSNLSIVLDAEWGRLDCWVTWMAFQWW